MNIIKKVLLIGGVNERAIFRNSFWLSISELFSRIIKFYLIIYINNKIGPYEFGRFSYAFSYANIFGAVFDIGLTTIIIREFAKNSKNEIDLSYIFIFKAIIGIFITLILFLVSIFVIKDIGLHYIVIITCLFFVLTELTGTIFALYRARQKMQLEAIVKIAQGSVLIISFFGLFYFYKNIFSLAYSYLLSALLPLIAVLWFVIKSKGAIFNNIIINYKCISIIKKYLKMSLPVALFGIVSSVYAYSDSFLLGYFGFVNETGIYTTFIRIISMTLLPMTLISQAIFPKLSKEFDDAKAMQSTWNLQTELMICLSFPIFIFGLIYSKQIILLLLGKTYLSGIKAFNILLFNTLLYYFYIAFYQLMIVINQQKKLLYISMIGAIINLILNIILIKKYVMNGAAISIVISNLIVLILLVLFAIRNIKINVINKKILKYVLISGFSSLTLGIVMLFRIDNIYISGSVSIVLYAISYYILRKGILSNENNK